MKKKLNTLGHTVVIGALIAAPASAFAEIQMGGLGVSPGIALKLQQDDNIAGDRKDQLPVSSMITTITPSVDLSLKKPWGDAYSAGYNVAVVRYADSSKDDHETQTLKASANYPFTPKSMANLSASYTDGATMRGSLFDALGNTNNRDQDDPNKPDGPDEFTASNVNAKYQLGKENNIYLSGGLSKRRYDNNELTTLTSETDVSTVTLGGGLKLGAKTNLTASIGNTTTKNINATTNDSSALGYALGASWTPSTMFSIAVGLSASSTDYDDNTVNQDTDKDGYSLSVTFNPISVLTLNAGISKTNNPALGDYGDETVASTNFELTYRPVSNVSAYARIRTRNVNAKDLVAPLTDKDDTTDTTSVGVSYQMRKWLSFALDNTATTTKAKVGESSEKNVTGLTITAKF